MAVISCRDEVSPETRGPERGLHVTDLSCKFCESRYKFLFAFDTRLNIQL